MKNKIKKTFFLLIIMVTGCISSATITDPKEHFVSMDELNQDIVLDIRYFTENNFLGTKVRGYLAPKCYLTHEASKAILEVQKELETMGYGIKVFDCYRPQRAVDHFVQWAADLNDTKNKSAYYPNVNKKDLLREDLSYIASRSGHSRGSTLDLTLIDLETRKELDMGTPFDYFDVLSHTDNPEVSVQAQKNRQTLKRVMDKHGFQNYEREWWHYTLRNEPHPETYFDFPVE